jgi:thiol-disulfide isomerase/thioredoxin
VVAIILAKEAPLAEILAGARAIPPSTLKQETTEIPNVGIPEYTQTIEYSETPDHTQKTEYTQATEYSQTPEYTQTPEYSQTPENTQEEVATITPESSPASLSPAEQYKYAIANRKPTLVFFHSNTCKSCLDMIDTVNEVYPEFFHLVVLIDVNVYDPQNEDLVNRVGINLIPTLVFYNQTGDSLFSIGVISSEELRQKLSDISQGKIP